MSLKDEMEKVLAGVRAKAEVKGEPVPKTRCEVFKNSMETVLKYSYEDLVRYRELCLDKLLGVLRPESERCEILDRVDTINKELQTRREE